MEVNQLIHFVAAAETESFAVAARRCITSRQNIARSVSLLAKELGVELFQRSGNSMVLTKDGKRALEYARRILGTVEEFVADFAARGEELAKLRASVGTNLLTCVEPNILELAGSFPGAPVQISEKSCMNCYKDVLEGKADVAVVACMLREFPGCESIELARYRFYCVMSSTSRLAGKERILVDDLKGHTILLMPDPDFQYGELLEQCKLHGIGADQIDIISSVGAMLKTIQAGDAVGIGTREFLNVSHRNIEAVPFADQRMEWRIYALLRDGSPNRSTAAGFARHLKRGFA